jgi:hypothetical protein
MKCVWIVAGTIEECEQYCREKGLIFWKDACPCNVVTFRGRHLPEDGHVVYVGTWKNRADLFEIQREIVMATHVPEGQMYMEFYED